jgi:ribosomal protein L37AE/L43A
MNACTQRVADSCTGSSVLDYIFQGVWMCKDCSGEYAKR